MREIHRDIVSAIIISKDNQVLMGPKDPNKGGVYSDCWHIPGGGIEEGEDQQTALLREIQQETGLDLSQYPIISLPDDDQEGVSEKTLKNTEETVLCHMKFNRFKIIVHDKTATEITINHGDDLVKLRWFNSEELAEAKQIPGGREYFQSIGLIPPDKPSEPTIHRESKIL